MLKIGLRLTLLASVVAAVSLSDGCTGGDAGGGGANAPDAFAKTKDAGGTAEPLGFVIWSDDPAAQPAFVTPGASGSFADGNTIELVSTAAAYPGKKGVDVGAVTFTMTLEEDGEILAGHSFSMQGFPGGANPWLIADPAATKPNASMTSAFLEALIALGGGSHDLTVKVFGETGGTLEIINEGKLSYDGSSTAKHQALVPKFADIEATRAAANSATSAAETKKLEEASAQRAADSEARNKFKVTIKNQDTGHTKYVISIHQRTLSEDITEVTPGASKTLTLSRGSSYELKWYDQDQDKGAAASLGKVDESNDGASYTIK